HRNLAREVARESIVLLKNENILPLDNAIKNLALIGPHADNKRINGNWSLMGNPNDNISLKMGIEEKVGNEVNIIYEKGCSFKGLGGIYVDNVKKACEQADVIILALGETDDMSGESKSRGFITIPYPQEELAQIALSMNKPTVLVLFNGRPLEIKNLADKVPAILEVWFPGTEGGNAIVDVLFGDSNPSGKLTMSFPYTVGQIPVYYNHYNTGRPYKPGDKVKMFRSNYIDIPNEPLYPFGFGLSYTTFEYSEIEMNKSKMHSNEEIKAKITLTNTGKFEGSEIVQMYIQDLYGSVVCPVKELKGFKKIRLKPGENKEVEFLITNDNLRFWNSEMKFVAEPGSFKVYIGTNSEDIKVAEFELI
ncbi:MAG: glycoside hydrolase family 3 C-terminal domain-containing protein, partial [Promethearchaeota archaeon]